MNHKQQQTTQQIQISELPMKKICLLRLSALGDVVLVVPLVNALIRSYPNIEITWVTTQSTLDLIGPMNQVKWIIVKKPKSIRAIIANRKLLKDLKFEILLVLQASFSAHIACMQINAKRKIGFDRQRGKDFHHLFTNESINYENQHFVDAYLSFGKKVGASDTRVSWSGAFTKADERWAKQILDKEKRCIAIVTSPSKAERRWTLKSYKKTIEYLATKEVAVYLLGSSKEEEISFNSELSEFHEKHVCDLTGQTNLNQISAFLKHVDLLISPDTGAVHIARALNTPVIGLYAVANPALCGPYDSQDLVINKYHDAVEKFSSLKETPNYHFRVHHDKAMSLIQPEEVIEKINEFLNSANTLDR